MKAYAIMVKRYDGKKKIVDVLPTREKAVMTMHELLEDAAAMDLKITRKNRRRAEAEEFTIEEIEL